MLKVLDMWRGYLQKSLGKELIFLMEVFKKYEERN